MDSISKQLAVFGIVFVGVCCHINTTNGLPLESQKSDSGMVMPINREGRAATRNLKVLDNINVETYLKNKRAVNSQIKCVLKNGPCDSVGKEIKRLMPMVLHDENLCDECNETQRKKINQIVDHLRDNYPEEWSEGIKKYGKPQGL